MANNDDIDDIDHGTDLDDFEESPSNSIAIIAFLGMGVLVLGYLAYKLLASDTSGEEVKKPLLTDIEINNTPINEPKRKTIILLTFITAFILSIFLVFGFESILKYNKENY